MALTACIILAVGDDEGTCGPDPVLRNIEIDMRASLLGPPNPEGSFKDFRGLYNLTPPTDISIIEWAIVELQKWLDVERRQEAEKAVGG